METKQEEIFKLEPKERFELIDRVEKKMIDDFNNTLYWQDLRLRLAIRELVLLFIIAIRKVLTFKIRF